MNKEQQIARQVEMTDTDKQDAARKAYENIPGKTFSEKLENTKFAGEPADLIYPDDGEPLQQAEPVDVAGLIDQWQSIIKGNLCESSLTSPGVRQLAINTLTALRQLTAPPGDVAKLVEKWNWILDHQHIQVSRNVEIWSKEAIDNLTRLAGQLSYEKMKVTEYLSMLDKRDIIAQERHRLVLDQERKIAELEAENAESASTIISLNDQIAEADAAYHKLSIEYVECKRIGGEHNNGESNDR